MTDTVLQELIRISNQLGRNPTLVLGSFGNTSIKTEDGRYMYIKASGTQLKDMTETAGWRKLDNQKVLDILNDDTLNDFPADRQQEIIDTTLMAACCDDKTASVRPSIESFFHAILNTCVIHLHPESVLGLACANNGRQHLQKLFAGTSHQPLWIPYVGLGFASAREIQRHIKLYQAEYGQLPKILVIQNHGIIIHDADINAAMDLTEAVMQIFEKVAVQLDAEAIAISDQQKITRIAHDIDTELIEITGKKLRIRHYNCAAISAFMNLPQAGRLCQGNPLTNDEAAFTHGPPLWLEQADTQSITTANQAVAKTGKAIPAAFLVKGIGLFIASAAENHDDIAEVSQAYMRIRAAADQMGGPRPIPKTLLDQYAEPAPSQ